MTVKLEHIIRILDKIAPLQLKEEWDNPGLQIGDPGHEIRKILVALDPTKQALKSAHGIGAQLLLTHHPLIFHPLKSINRRTYPGDLLFLAIEMKISIISLHTNLDKCKEGINWILGRRFELRDIEPLKDATKDTSDGYYIGIIGNTDKSVNLSEFIKKVKRILGINLLKVMGNLEDKIRRVAIIGGSGGGFISVAKQNGADVLLTGETAHHHAIEARRLGIMLIDGGHFSIESEAMRIFSDMLDKKLKDLGLDIKVEYYIEEAPYRFE